MALLADMNSATASTHDCPVITKKVRHELVGENKQKHFRRSRVYMSTKVLLQHSLTMKLGEELGKFVYKIVMMKFFTELCKPYIERGRVTFDIDLLGDMIAKMARRIEKLLDIRPDQLSDEYVQFLELTIQRSKQTIKSIRHKIEIQIRKIQHIDEKRSIKPLKRLDFQSDVRHKIPTLEEYLNERIMHVTNIDGGANGGPEFQVKSYRRHFTAAVDWPAVEVIGEINVNADEANSTKEHDGGLERRLFWMDFENVILYGGDLNDKSADVLRSWALEYLKYGEQTYTDNQLSMSRMLLVYLKIIETLDRRLSSDGPYQLLREHSTCVNAQIFEALLLPQRVDMEIAYILQQYFETRNQDDAGPGLVDEKTVSDSSFSVQFAKQNDTMKTVCKTILARDKENIKQKRLEWEEKRQQVADLREEMNAMDTCYIFEGRKVCSPQNCYRCRKTVEIENVKIDRYEHLLPEKECEQLAIAFEVFFFHY